jgi:hypothetical protein
LERLIFDFIKTKPRMKTTLLPLISALLIFGTATVLTAQQLVIPDALFSRAEKTWYTETTLNAEVIRFCETLAGTSDLATVHHFGKTTEGNPLVMVVLAEPKISTPAEAVRSGKPVVYIQGNIHAGEVEGKEASMRLMREICFGPKRALLKDQILIFCPNFNPDGNDKLSSTSRPSQAGSPELTGLRSTGQGLDLNREGIKNEGVEVRALISEILLKWDPMLMIDLHTDNGSWHGYALNYAPAYLSAGMPSTSGYINDILLPEVTKTILDRSGLPMFYHGYMRARPGDPTTFATYSHLPRYLVNYMGLRNRMAILSETFAHDNFEKRVLNNYVFMVSVLEYTSDHAAEMAEVVRAADRETVKIISENSGILKKGVTYIMEAEPEKISLLTRETVPYTDENGRNRARPTGRTHWVDSVIHMNHFRPAITSVVPSLYYFPAELEGVASKLREHGIIVGTISKKVKSDVQEFYITKYTRATRPAYGDHRTVTVEGSFSGKSLTIPAGSFVVDMRQPLAWLIFYMLEPQSDDGLLFWNYFDDYLLTRGVETKPVAFPVWKVTADMK